MIVNRHDPATAIPLLMKSIDKLDSETKQIREKLGNTGQNMYRVDIYASKGSLLRGGITSTELKAKIYSWDIDITDELPESFFSWTRNSGDENADSLWSERYGQGKKSIAVIGEDVGEQSTFLCTVTDNDKMFAQAQIVVSSNVALEGAIESISVIERQMAEIEENADAAIEAAEVAKESAASALQEMDAVNGEIEAAREARGELQKELATLRTTMEAEYATKGELTEVNTNLSSEIERNAAQISSTLSQVEQIEINTSQAIVDASEAKIAAETAQNAADEAQRRYEILQAQADVTDSELAAAKLDVQNAQLAAELAQDAADTAQAAADSLGDRLVKAEASIIQNADSIKQLVSRMTEIERTLDDLPLYTHIRYAPVENPTEDQMTEDPAADSKYIGICNTRDSEAPTDPTAYGWAKFKGDPGEQGKVGTGIESITPQYYVSTSVTEPADGEWVYERPLWQDERYLWTRSEIIYKNPASTEYTTPICDNEWIDGYVTKELAVASSQILQTAEEITLGILSGYTTANDLAEYKKEIENLLKVSEEGFAFEFSQLEERLSSVGGSVVTQSQYIRLEQGNVIIGKSDNPITAVFTNDALEFRYNDRVVARFTDEVLEVRNIRVDNQVQFGSNWAIRPGEYIDGVGYNLNDVWIGG